MKHNIKAVTAFILSASLLCLTSCGNYKGSDSNEIQNESSQASTGTQRSNSTSEINVGDTVSFGSYVQDTDEAAVPIEWKVLAAQEDKILLLTDKIIDAHVYHSERADISWSDCDLRSYLNGSFY